MINAIKRTLKRLSAKIYIFNPIEWYPKLLEGLSVEFGRVRDFKNQVLSATVPNDNMWADSIEDYNNKYGIPNTLNGTDAQKISRIIEKASLSGFPGPEWLEDQLHMAGFDLYVVENKPQMANVRQWGTFQWGTSGVQYGLTSRYVDPDTILGELVVGSPPWGSGRIILNQYGSFQWGTPGLQWGTLDPNALNPQPVLYERTTNPTYWGFYFTLSPFDGVIATSESQFLEVSEKEFEYLKNLIIELKLQRNWCILQAKAV